MESWRDFFNRSSEPEEKLDPREPNLSPFGYKMGQPKPEQPALFIRKDGEIYMLILWRPTKINNKGWILRGEVLGMLWFSKTDKPCIPDTYQVNYVSIRKEFEGQGIGPLMYGLAFHYVNQVLGGGLTSDHAASSNKHSKAAWDKLSKTKNLIKRTTDAGNDEFDYENDTPDDKEDDCDVGKGTDVTFKSMFFGKKYRGGIGTNSSWTMEPNQYSKVYDKMSERHQKYSRSAKNIRSLENELIGQSANLFAKRSRRRDWI